jgi:hypothetical protein
MSSYLVSAGPRQFEVHGAGTDQEAKQEIERILQKFGTATCGGPYLQHSTHPLTASVISGGTGPFIYSWTITSPTGGITTLIGPSQSYTFSQAGTYGISMTVADSCPAGAKIDTSTCNVTVTASQPPGQSTTAPAASSTAPILIGLTALGLIGLIILSKGKK